MKRIFLTIAAVATIAFGLASCEGVLEGVLGGVQLKASDATAGEQYYANGDSLNFNSSLCNVKFDTLSVQLDTLGLDSLIYDLDPGTIMIGSTSGLGLDGEEVEINFPLFALNLRGDEAKKYNIYCPVDDLEFYQAISDIDVNSLISSGLTYKGEGINLFVVVVSEEAFYLGYAGDVNITKYGNEGSTVEGTVNNVKCYYVNIKKLEQLVDMEPAQLATIDIDSYFPQITFNGKLKSRRVNIDAVLDMLEQ